MANISNTITVTLDEELAQAAAACAAECGLQDVQALIVYLLRGVLQVEENALDDQELALVEERLRGLGYME